MINFHASCQKPKKLHFDRLLLSKAYKVLDEKVQKCYVSWQKWCKGWRKTDSWFVSKNDMRNLVNFNAISRKSENLHFDVLLLPKVCTEELCCEKWLMVSKMTEGIWWTSSGKYFLDKSSPSNFKFLDFALLVWSCLNSSCNFCNQESVFV